MEFRAQDGGEDIDLRARAEQEQSLGSGFGGGDHAFVEMPLEPGFFAAEDQALDQFAHEIQAGACLKVAVPVGEVGIDGVVGQALV